jgi:hypothetical protein
VGYGHGEHVLRGTGRRTSHIGALLMKRLLAAASVAAGLLFATAGHAVEVYDQPLTTEGESPLAAEPAHPAAAGLENLYHLAGSVPEPMTWAMMIIGFGAAGQILRRRRAMGHL